ncbi:hypothetical protein LU674_001520 [Pseudomonas alloputida]|jgi:hypothetical protein|uniref:Uncharacterized protein n=1 Tax=Pseudomonas alloputida TaxID=1940621 RepID=A0AAW7HDV0_9PSED|nr:MULTISPECIES: hypothetical protein [Pseudomonas]MDM3951030.1 hypothetical protein [Pseudomonas alloputida]TXG97281.1 MAG: hypothetical protein E6R08_07360 [Nevskiaceae bacterium]
MKRKFKNGNSGWKTNWLGVCERPRFFTIVTLKAMAMFVVLTVLSLLRSAVVLVVIALLVSTIGKIFTSTESFDVRSLAVLDGIPDYFTLIVMILVWHGMVCDVFAVLRKWRQKRIRSRNEIKMS